MMALLQAAYLLGTAFVLPKSANFAAIFASVLVDQTNFERNADSLGALTINPQLEVAARLKAEDMASKGYFSHNSPDGKTPWYWFEKAGYNYAAAGENLAVNFTDSRDITEAWMHSPLHRANILNGNYTEIGIATVQGIYKGKSAIFVVQEFGRQSIIARQLNAASSTVSSLTELITDATSPITTEVSPRTKVQLIKSTTTATSRVKTFIQPKIANIKPIAQAEMPTTTAVAGVETQKLDIQESSFAETVVPKPPEPTSMEVFLASPRHITTTIYIALFVLLTLALSSAILIKIHIQHRRIILNGIILLTVITILIVLNAVFEFSRGVV